MNRPTTQTQDVILTQDLAFSAALICLGYHYLEASVGEEGRIQFHFHFREGKVGEIQRKYEQWVDADLQVPGRKFVREWRRLRREIDAVKERHLNE